MVATLARGTTGGHPAWAVALGACVLLASGCPGSTQASVKDAKGGKVETMVPPEADDLGGGDVIDVKIFGEPELSGAHKVRSDGTVVLPLVGRVKVKGLNPEEAAEAIRGAYRNGYLNDPEVLVTVTAFNSKRFYVLGSVGRPGVFTYEDDMDMLRAIIMAGGLSGAAAGNRVVVTRTVNGREIRFEVPADDISQGRAKNIPVMPGDIIYVPTSVL